MYVSILSLLSPLCRSLCLVNYTSPFQGVYFTPTYPRRHVRGGDSENKEAGSAGRKLSLSYTTHLADNTAPLPSPQLPDSYCLGVDDVEGFMSSH